MREKIKGIVDRKCKNQSVYSKIRLAVVGFVLRSDQVIKKFFDQTVSNQV